MKNDNAKKLIEFESGNAKVNSNQTKQKKYLASFSFSALSQHLSRHAPGSTTGYRKRSEEMD